MLFKAIRLIHNGGYTSLRIFGIRFIFIRLRDYQYFTQFGRFKRKAQPGNAGTNYQKIYVSMYHKVYKAECPSINIKNKLTKYVENLYKKGELKIKTFNLSTTTCIFPQKGDKSRSEERRVAKEGSYRRQQDGDTRE